MINFLDICIKPTLSIEDAMGVINRGNVRIACVVDVNNRLLGTLNDGDIRRGILKGKRLSDSINDVYHTDAIFADESTTEEKLLNLCLQKQINQIPVIDNNKKIVDLFVLNDPLSRKQYENNVVLMVGGLGTRLRPLTDNTPKPMLKVGGKPILQTIVEGFAKSGFANISMCLGYKSNAIKNFFQDGSEFGVNIDYVVEDKRMGTAGALTLLTKKLDKPFFVMNGDLLTNVDYENMLDFHSSNDSKATMCVREYDVEVPYGVVSTINEEITSIKEKPIHRFFVNAGIYLLEPGCVDLIPKGEFYDMPSLFDKLISNNEKVVSFPLKEYWIDIGQMDDFNQAHNDYIEVFID
jgi:dTDP-glucose pyrophosphorylase